MNICMESRLTCFTRKEKRLAIEVDMWWSLSVMGLVPIEVRVRSLPICVIFMADEYFCFAVSVLLHKGSILISCSYKTEVTKQCREELLWKKHMYMRETGSIPSRFQHDYYKCLLFTYSVNVCLLIKATCWCRGDAAVHTVILCLKWSLCRPAQSVRVPGCWDSQISRNSTLECGKVVNTKHRPPLPQ